MTRLWLRCSYCWPAHVQNLLAKRSALVAYKAATTSWASGTSVCGKPIQLAARHAVLEDILRRVTRTQAEFPAKEPLAT